MIDAHRALLASAGLAVVFAATTEPALGIASVGTLAAHVRLDNRGFSPAGEVV